MSKYYKSRTYAVHYRDGWEAMGQDKEVPVLTRLVALAYARTDSNAHAQFGHGELMQILCVEKDKVQRLIGQAVKARLLDPMSCASCLVAPAHISDHRYLANPCDRHKTKAYKNDYFGP